MDLQLTVPCAVVSTQPARPILKHIGDSRQSVVCDVSSGVPTIVYWGAALNATSLANLDAIAAATARPSMPGVTDALNAISLVPCHGDGATMRPGIGGHRPGGRHWAPRFSFISCEVVDQQLITIARDDVAQLELETKLECSAWGTLHTNAILRNVGESRYLLTNLTITLPVAASATQLLTFSGRWAREAQLHRRDFVDGAWTAENRTGRTSHEHLPLIFATERVADEWNGQVWGAHLAWSGNSVLLAEVLPDGRKYMQLGELLHAGELCLEPGESYATPEVIGVWSGNGLNAATQALHRNVRSRSHHPTVLSPRKVMLNTWEAVYFDHDLNRLCALADVAANVGVERFVLDDGWFGSRRNDKSGLGDWFVSPDVYPNGLAPLISHVQKLGMDFGIWVEPEMVNPDSDLFRAHPEWVLTASGYEPVLARNQLVLNLSHPDAYAHIYKQLDALLSENDIAYVKWDMNRAHVHATGSDGAAGTHNQTRAVYQLIDQLRAAHPTVEIESCASGGGRIDHEILRRTERVWTSDCNDALERQIIARGTSMLVPLEVLGAHIGPPTAHTTGRRQSLSFRGATAMFGHLGVEWNLLTLRDDQQQQLRHIIDLYKQHRELLHSGDFVRYDVTSDNSAVAHGVISTDKRKALMCYAQLISAQGLVPSLWKIHGLLSDVEYTVTYVPLGDSREHASLTMTGDQLGRVGIQPPMLFPESAVLIYLRSQ
jgi:alpha-galactosidase